MVYAVKESLDWSDWLYYDETSPSCLRWKVEIRRGKGKEVICVSIGDSAGYFDKSEYWIVGIGGDIYKGHRIVWELHNSVLGNGEFIDHINGDSNNNTLSNLRVVDRATNQRNRGMNKGNSSGVTGVSYRERDGGGWRAKWHTLDGKRVEKYFAVQKYGNDEAFRLACEYREAMIASLNEQGAGYTHDHGKR